VRVFNALKRNRITTVSDVYDLLEQEKGNVTSIRNLGEKSLDELRRRLSEFERRITPNYSYEPVIAPPPLIDVNAVLHEMARQQQLDGSWRNDVELTAAVLITFLRHGHTLRKGNYRKQVQCAFDWLEHARASGFAAFLRVIALRARSEITQYPQHISCYQQAFAKLPKPADNLQTETYNLLSGHTGSISLPDREVVCLDELRLAFVAGISFVKIKPDLLNDELGRTLTAGILVKKV